MRTPGDALRSFKRHLALTLGAEWEVRLTGEEGTFSRPFARVGTVGAARLAGQSAYMAEWVLTFNVVAHPVERETADEARLEAERVRQLVFVALRGQPALPGRPKRIPLWNYDGVPVTRDVCQDATERAALAVLYDADPGYFVVAPRAARGDFLRADVNDEPSVDVVGDSSDELMYAVTGSIPLRWTVATDLPVLGPPATGVGASFPPGP